MRDVCIYQCSIKHNRVSMCVYKLNGCDIILNICKLKITFKNLSYLYERAVIPKYFFSSIGNYVNFTLFHTEGKGFNG